jgi:4-hydroxythreonine-4-phosphate dehydrogenase
MNKTTQKLKIGISIGDINGIGLEVVLKTLSDKRLLSMCTPVLYGATKVISYHKNIAKINQLNLHQAKSVEQLKENAVNVINCWTENVKIELGQCTADGGKYAHISLQHVADDLKKGLLDAMVTAPINKEAMTLANFGFPGHTEFLTHTFEADSLMLMVHENLRVGLVTNHVPLKEVATHITKELILQKIELLHRSLCMDFGVSKPAIAILGLNPHAGDGGVIGQEEKDIILPAIEAAKAKGILAIGPYPADGFFGSDNYRKFDGVLAMYHDQGLVPFKTIAFGGGVNFTAGLPVVRTSPDHGTGFDIAGKGIAEAASFRQALYTAIDAAKQRAAYLEMTANPIKNHLSDSKEDGGKKRNKGKGNRNSRDDQRSKNSNKPKTEGKKEPKKQSPKKEIVAEQKEMPKKEAAPVTPAEKTPSKPKAPAAEVKQKMTIEERLALAAKKKEAQKKEVAPDNTPEKVDITTEE